MRESKQIRQDWKSWRPGGGFGLSDRKARGRHNSYNEAQRVWKKQPPGSWSSLVCWRKEKKTRLAGMYSAKGSVVPDKFGDDLPIFWLETMSSQKTWPVSFLSPHLWASVSGYFSITLHLVLLSALSFNMDDHVLPFPCKDNIPRTLTTGEGSFGYFSIRDDKFVPRGLCGFTDGSCNQEWNTFRKEKPGVKRAAQQGFRK